MVVLRLSTGSKKPPVCSRQFNELQWQLMKTYGCCVVSDSLGLRTLSLNKGKNMKRNRDSIYLHLSSSEMEVSNDIINFLICLEGQEKDIMNSVQLFIGDDSTCASDLPLDFHLRKVPTLLLLYDGYELARYEDAQYGGIIRFLRNKEGIMDRYFKHTLPMTSLIKPSLVRSLNSDGIAELTHEIINSAPLILFLKGTKQRPMCKFSRRFVEIMNTVPGIAYTCWNILEDSSIRDCIAKIAQNKIFPQLWSNGKLIGNVDELTDMAHAGKLLSLVQETRRNTLRKNEIKVYEKICSAPVVCIIFGTQDNPHDGLSRRLLHLLTICQIEFTSINILDETDIGLLASCLFVEKGCWDSNESAFPLVFANGFFVGGYRAISATFELGGARGLRDLLLLDP